MEILLISHWVPLKPGMQVHSNAPMRFEHSPPFIHGVESHSLISKRRNRSASCIVHDGWQVVLISLLLFPLFLANLSLLRYYYCYTNYQSMEVTLKKIVHNTAKFQKNPMKSPFSVNLTPIDIAGHVTSFGRRRYSLNSGQHEVAWLAQFYLVWSAYISWNTFRAAKLTIKWLQEN